MSATYGVRSICVGHGEIPGPELFWMHDWDKWYPIDFQSILIEGHGVTALVNTGAQKELKPMNDLWASILGERARMRRKEGEFITEALAKAGVKPTDVTHVFVTPFQLYTASNIPLFTNAQICLSKRGWIHYHTSKSHPHDARWHCIPKDVLVHLVTDGWDRVRLLEDEDQVAPGIRTWWAGVHHRASIAVEVDSTAGTVVISDAFFYYENVEEDRLLGINENMYEAMVTNARARKADHRVPIYDPKVFQRYPGGVVARRPE